MYFTYFKFTISYNRDVPDKIFYLRPGFGEKNCDLFKQNKISMCRVAIKIFYLAHHYYVI